MSEEQTDPKTAEQSLQPAEERILASEVARQLVDGEVEIDTSVFTNAEPDAAQILVSDSYIFRETLGGRINLDGIVNLDGTVAAALAELQDQMDEDGELAPTKRDLTISLRGVKDLPATVAACLAPCQAALDLSGLTSISDDAAAAIGASDKHQSFGHHGALYLDGLTELSDRAALGLNRQKGLLSLKGLKSLSDAAASALLDHVWPIALDPAILGDSPSQVALRKRAEKSRFVEIGVTDPHGEIFGATALKIHWELGSEVQAAGFDADWARASVMYDFASGNAWKFDIFPDLIDKDVAVPQLYGEIYITAPDEEKIWSSQEELTLSLERDTVVDIIKKVHAKARELLVLKDSKFFNN
jgi:hypothetical protein